MEKIPIKDVSNPTHIESSVFRRIDKADRILQEVYAGSIVTPLQNAGPTISRFEFKSFLPIFGATIRGYPPVDVLDSALVVAPIGFSAKEDEEFFCSVDDFELRLEPQVFPGIGGAPHCLVLHFNLALLNGRIFHIGYHVTVQMPRVDFDEITLNRRSSPA